jgi:hypothetical protein
LPFSLILTVYHGNVKTLLQVTQEMAQDPLLVDPQFKRMDYNYDLISGNLHRVSYENGKIDLCVVF